MPYSDAPSSSSSNLLSANPEDSEWDVVDVQVVGVAAIVIV
jgi:hypothetical protein